MAERRERGKKPSETAGRASAKPSETAGRASTKPSEMDDILKVIIGLAKDPKTAPLAESVAGTLLTVIGSGPSFAAMQSMVAANQANGQMFFNAVAQQQMTNVVGMVATMNCVQSLLDKPSPVPWPFMPDLSPAENDDEAF